MVPPQSKSRVKPRKLGVTVELVLDTPWGTPIRETLAEGFVISEGATVAAPSVD